MAVIELVDRNVDAKLIDKPKKVAKKETEKQVDNKIASK